MAEHWMAVGAPNNHSVPQDLMPMMHRSKSYMVGSGDVLGESNGLLPVQNWVTHPVDMIEKALSIRDALVSKHRKMGNFVDDGRWMEGDENGRQVRDTVPKSSGGRWQMLLSNGPP